MCDVLSATMQRKDDPRLLKYANIKRSQGRFNDVTIKTGNKLIPANRLVLSCYSKYFETMFETEMKEKYENVVELESVDQDSLEILIDFIYTGMIKIDEKNAKTLLSAADYLLIDDVKEYCFEFLGSSITTDNCLSILIYAMMYENNCLTRKVMDVVSENFVAVSVTDEFLNFPKDSLVTCISKVNRNQVKEKLIYEAVVSWVNNDMETRKKDFMKLFSLINLDLLSSEFLVDVVFSEHLILESSLCLKQLQQALSKNLNSKKLIPRSTNILSVGSEHGSVVVWKIGNPSMTEYPNLPVKLLHHSSLVFNNSIYVIGGKNSKNQAVTNQVWKMDLHQDPLAWQKVPSMLHSKYDLGTAVFKNYLVVAGGTDELDIASRTSEVYDDLFDEWESISELNQSRCENALVPCDDVLFCLGGQDDNYNALSSVEKLCHFESEWKFAEPMLSPRSGVAAVSCQGFVYAMGGCSENNYQSTLKSVEKYNPVMKKWTYVSSMNVERCNHSAFVIENQIYVFSGLNKNMEEVKEIECYDVSRDEWVVIGETNGEWCKLALVTV